MTLRSQQADRNGDVRIESVKEKKERKNAATLTGNDASHKKNVIYYVLKVSSHLIENTCLQL